MSKKNIECEYCHTLITEDDVKCPHCGANCSNVIKKYREEHKDDDKEKIDEIFGTFNKVADRNSKVVSVIAVVIFLIVAAVMVTQFMSFGKRRNNMLSNNINTNTIIDDEPPDEKVTVGFNEEAATSEMKVILDSYELYEYHSNNFESYNTPKGYQKIAFHFSIENLDDYDLSTYSLITLTADDSMVDKSDLELHVNFEKVVKGKEKYEKIINNYIGSGKVLKGYAGYLVPKDKKILKFYIGDEITIEMENPAYSG